MKKQINDIRIKVQDKVNTIGNSGTLSCATNGIYNVDYSNKEIEIRELVNPNRRKLLKIVAASSGVLIAGSILNKVSKLNGLPLGDQSASAFKSLFSPNSKTKGVMNPDDLSSFFENFSIVKNDKEYILYNKEGDNILIIDRDA